jgi:hypothetical protein
MQLVSVIRMTPSKQSYAASVALIAEGGGGQKRSMTPAAENATSRHKPTTASREEPALLTHVLLANDFISRILLHAMIELSYVNTISCTTLHIR